MDGADFSGLPEAANYAERLQSGNYLRRKLCKPQLITRRSKVRVLPPQPEKETVTERWLFFFSLFRKEGLERSNATVRWTVAHARLDGHDTFVAAHSRAATQTSPDAPTNNANRKRYRFGKPRNHNGFWVFSCHFSRWNSKDIISQKRPLGRT